MEALATANRSKAAAAKAAPSRARLFLREVKRYRMLLLMTVPGLVYLFINNYIPMYGVILAFKNLNYVQGIWGSPWVGMDNFKFLFNSPDAYLITRNTILYNVAFIIVNLVLALTVALLINEIKDKVVARFYQSTFLLPHIISMVVVAYLVYSFLNADSGLVNRQLSSLFGFDSISWYNEPQYWPYILVIVNAWKGVGFLAIIYFAAIIGIDKEYYEAAIIDGAGKWKQMTRITLPLIAPVIIVMTLLAISSIMRSDFGLFYQVTMNSGPLMPTTNTIDTFVYRAMVKLGDIGMSAAAGFYQSVVCFFLILSANFAVRRISKNDALF
ncbi:putative aldouronate transport system permease protein [Cohnella phaseoli]|uniref:Putative aldouronate transport system permease protein n=1 Tax=Cohnella phaseoli TaxID=456490 RepID=A0A3D9IMP2_9BACL|nr:ABC transporter permease subunit [Cohnella phaseoli]RED62978.1 putative aldouronate transport system permease protein [Cohnella phaseoli]